MAMVMAAAATPWARPRPVQLLAIVLFFLVISLLYDGSIGTLSSFEVSIKSLKGVQQNPWISRNSNSSSSNISSLNSSYFDKQMTGMNQMKRDENSKNSEHLLRNNLTTAPLSASQPDPVFVHMNSTTNNSAYSQQSQQQQQSVVKPHPHAGARYPNGTWGYIADVTQVRRWVIQQYNNKKKNNHDGLEIMPPMSYLFMATKEEEDSICHDLPGRGPEMTLQYYPILQKVKMNTSSSSSSSSSSSLLLPSENGTTTAAENETIFYNNNNNNNKSNTTGGTSSPLRLLCAIYTYEKRKEHTDQVAHTYGWRCDGFFAASTETILLESPDNTTSKSQQQSSSPTIISGLGSIDLPHLGDESYNNMWQKTRSILSYMYDYYMEDYDYFYVAGDDTMLFVENLKRYLSEVIEQRYNTTSEPLYIGQLVSHNSRFLVFNGGGPGYVLNREALRRVVEHFPACLPNNTISAEDRFLGRCMAQLGISPINTADRHGQQRFLGTPPKFIVDFNGQGGFHGGLYQYWAQENGFKAGVDLVSEQSIAFHYWKKENIHFKRDFAIWYKSCPGWASSSNESNIS